MPFIPFFVAGGLVAVAWFTRRNVASSTQMARRKNPETEHDLAPKFSPAKGEHVENERIIDQHLFVSVSSLALTGGGALFYPPLALLAIPGLVYSFSYIARRSFYLIVHEKTYAVAVLDVVSNAAPALFGWYFATAISYCVFFISRKLFVKTEQRGRRTMLDILGQLPRRVWIKQGDTEIEVPLDSLRHEDIVVIRAGEVVPVDGVITKGVGAFDQHTLTGEAQPVEKEPGDSVFATTLLLSGRLEIQIEKCGADTVSGRITEMLNHAADFKTAQQSRGEAMVAQGAVVTMTATVASLLLLGPQSSVAMTYAGFGYQMRIAGPLGVLNFLHLGARRKLLIKDGRALEQLAEVDTVIFDKTGTLTESVPEVTRVVPCHGYSEEQLLGFAAAAEHRQTHPIAQAIRREAIRREVSLPAIGEGHYETGYGIKTTVLDSPERLIRVGSARFMALEEIAIPAELTREVGGSQVFIAVDGVLGGMIALQPRQRDEARSVVEQLHALGLTLYIISGDHAEATRRVAETVGIDGYFAETLPGGKAGIVKELQREGRKVCFIGDGINDAPALRAADVAISMHGASTLATDSAEIVLLDGGLARLPYLFELADALKNNLDLSLKLSVLPGAICMAGIVVFHLGIGGAMMLYSASTAGSLVNAMLPLTKRKSRDH